MSLGTGWHEIERSYDRGVADASYWTGVRRYVGPKGAQELTSVQHLDDATWTTPEGVTLIPRKLKIVANAREGGSVGDVDCSEIEVLYRSAYNPITHPFGSATMTVEARPRQSKWLKDPSKNIVESQPDEKGEYYRVVEGSNLKIEHLSVVTIRTAYAIADVNTKWDDYLDLVDTVNDAVLTKIGVGKGKFRLIAIAIPKYFLYNSVVTHVPINYVFWYSKVHWNEIVDDLGTCKVQRYYRGPKAVRVIDTVDLAATTTKTYIHKDTEETGATEENAMLSIRVVDTPMKMLTTNATTKGYRSFFGESDFSTLAGLLWWDAP